MSEQTISAGDERKLIGCFVTSAISMPFAAHPAQALRQSFDTTSRRFVHEQIVFSTRSAEGRGPFTRKAGRSSDAAGQQYAKGSREADGGYDARSTVSHLQAVYSTKLVGRAKHVTGHALENAWEIFHWWHTIEDRVHEWMESDWSEVVETVADATP